MSDRAFYDGLHVITGTTFEESFSGRSRKGIGPVDVFKFNLQRMWFGLEALERIDERFHALIKRERRDIINRAVRSQYELKWASKATRCPMYLEMGCAWQDSEFISSEGTMEHSIPVSNLIDQILRAWPERSEIGSDECIFAATYYVALMAPVVLLSRATDRRLSKAGYHKRHPDQARPLSRYDKANTTILNYHGKPSNNTTLENHIELVKMTQAGRTYISDVTINEVLQNFGDQT